MSESITISKLNDQIRILNYELSKSKKKTTELENSLIKLQRQNADLKVRLSISLSKEIEYQNMKINLNEKNNIISDQEKEIANIRRNFEKQKKEFDVKYQRDVGDVRYINEKLNIRNETAVKFEKLNTLLYEHSKQLENTLLNFKNEEKRKLNEQELKFEKKLSDTKKKMLDLIKEGKSLKSKETREKCEIIEKFSIMNHNSLLNELEFESMQLEDLLKQREHLDQVITKMKSDISIHKNVEKVLVNKNKKYIDMIRILSEKIEKDKKEKEKEKKDNKNLVDENIINNEICNQKEKKLLYNKIKRNIESSKRYYEKKNEMNNSQQIFKIKDFGNKRLNLTNYKTKFLPRNKSLNLLDIKNKSDKNIYEKLQLQKELIRKTKEIDFLRDSCNHYKDKLNFINNKFSNILNLYDTVLGKIEKENIDELKDIYIDINEFSKYEFEKLSPDKKYSLAILLIQCILPLINENNLPDNIKKNMRNTQTKFFLNETCDSSVKHKNISTSFFDINMRENENKLREIRDGTWYKLKNKAKIRNRNKKENKN